MLTSENSYLDIDLEYLEKIVFKNCLEDDIYLNSIIDNPDVIIADTRSLKIKSFNRLLN